MGAIYRTVLILRMQEYTAPEIAVRLSIPQGTVKSRLNTIRKKLRAHLNLTSSEAARQALCNFNTF